MTPDVVVAASYRAHHLSIAVFVGTEPVLVATNRLPNRCNLNYEIRERLKKAVTDFDASMLVVEPHTPCSVVADNVGIPVERVTLAEAQRRILGKVTPSRQPLFNYLIATRPTFARFVSLLPGTLRVAMTERWRTVSLVSLALALVVVRER